MSLPVRLRTIYAGLPVVVRRLLLARAGRSLGQGALVAAFTLYLHALGWSAPAIGATLSAALLAGAVLTLIVGPLSDRVGRRHFLLLTLGLGRMTGMFAWGGGQRL
jgi:MFS family permease